MLESHPLQELWSQQLRPIQQIPMQSSRPYNFVKSTQLFCKFNQLLQFESPPTSAKLRLCLWYWRWREKLKHLTFTNTNHCVRPYKAIPWCSAQKQGKLVVEHKQVTGWQTLFYRKTHLEMAETCWQQKREFTMTKAAESSSTICDRIKVT